MTEEIVPEQVVVLEQVSRDDDMDLGHGTAETELDHSDVKLPQDIHDDMIGPVEGDIRDDMIDPIGGVDMVGLEPLGNLAGKPPNVQQSITTSLILANTAATKPNDSFAELPQNARDDMVDPIWSIDVAELESLKNLAEKAPSALQSVTASLVLTGTTNNLPLGKLAWFLEEFEKSSLYAVPLNMQNLIVLPLDEKARENLEALDYQIEEVKKALAELEVIRNSVLEASPATVLADTSSLNGLA
ncbi:hypothetical protein FCV25MIE_15975 [Fagus crenata]